MTIKMKTTVQGKGRENEESRVHVFVQQMLVTRIFAATYTGRHYVQPLKDYRDMVKVNKEENDLIRDLEIVKNRINNFYRGALWAAITGPADSEDEEVAGMCLWTKLENLAFGSYWFTISQVHFSEHGELVLGLHVIRKFESEVTATASMFDSSMNWEDVKTNLLFSAQAIGAFVTEGIRDLVTWHNLKESSRFLFLLLMTIGTGLMYGLQYLGDYSIKFFREFNNFIRVTTPIFLAVIDMVTKAIGGFYLLIAMLWRGNNQAPMPRFPSLMAAPPQQFNSGYQRRFPPRYKKEHHYQ